MSGEPRERRILFVHNDDPKNPLSSFILQDLVVLKKQYDVDVLSLHPYKHGHLDALLSSAVWRSVRRCDAVFGWFGSSAPIVVMASLLRKPSVLIAGGTDVVYVPEIDYGLNPRRSMAYRLYLLGYRLAKKVLLFSESSRQEYLRLPSVPKDRAGTLYLGVDTDHFRPGGAKMPQVLTISYISDSMLRRKGILTLLEAARLTPEISYRIAGLVLDQGAVRRIIAAAPPNVSFLGYLDENALLAELQQAKVYAQLSFHEGFGMAVAEAMACGCIPVVTDRGSLPEVAGDTGYTVPVDDPATAATAFRAALSEQDNAKSKRARERIEALFPPAARERGVLTALEEVLSR